MSEGRPLLSDSFMPERKFVLSYQSLSMLTLLGVGQSCAQMYV
jgi:hypothetical protein